MATTIPDLTRSWERSLRAAGRSPRTVDSYLESLGSLDAFLGSPPVDTIDREAVETWIIHLIETRSASTARVRYASVQQFFRWAVREDELSVDPMANMSPPSVPEHEVPVLTSDELTRLTDALEGSTFVDRRDAAIVWVLLTTGIRAAELVGMTTESVDLDGCMISVTGKGAKDRTVAIHERTILALDRYERQRARHARATSPAYWLGPKGGLTDSGLRQLVRRRGDAVGIAGLHPHQFRHTYAHRWLAKGGTEGGLQTAAGWASSQMVGRYGASAKAERARAESARLGLEDL